MDLTPYLAADLTYDEVGHATGPLPTGYHHVDRTESIGSGRSRFDEAARTLLSWNMHRGAGLTVTASSPAAELGAVVVLTLGPIRIPCRVVTMIDEPNRRGFAYGTLPGHPECGEELFVVQYSPADDAVTARIVAFSRPGRWYTRLGGPIGATVQRFFTGRYFAALR